MEKGDARPFQAETGTNECAWNVLELESRIHLRSKIHELIDLTNNSTLSTNELHKQLDLCQSQFGKRFSTQLVRALQRDDEAERDAIVWLLIQLHDAETIPLLSKMTQQEQQPHAVRLSAALALAGMGATREMTRTPRPRFYAIR
jgi:hypothetical protein